MAKTRGIDIAALTVEWDRLKQVDKNDHEGKRELAKVLAQLRKVDHEQLHPGEPLVEIDVPQHSTSTERHPTYFHLGNAASRRIYHGRCVVPRCVAHQLLALISQDRATDQARMTSNERRLVESGRISDIARQIAAT